VCWQDIGSSQPYTLQDANPPRIQERLDRYTN
jgi:hypothetical protein